MENTISPGAMAHTPIEECYAWCIETVTPKGKVETELFYNLRDAWHHGKRLKTADPDKFVQMGRIKKYYYSPDIWDLPSIGKQGSQVL